MTVQVTNKNKKTRVAGHVVYAKTFLTRLFGLMGKPYLEENTGLLITPCKEVHSLFMRFSLDVVFLDKENKVVHLKSTMKPWRVSRYVASARSVLELNAGSIQASQIEIGDELAIEHVN
ncbi:MAG: DUF192 domain-containing protein [Cyanobacteria bacterium P01_H01_bin.74]